MVEGDKYEDTQYVVKESSKHGLLYVIIVFLQRRSFEIPFILLSFHPFYIVLVQGSLDKACHTFDQISFLDSLRRFTAIFSDILLPFISQI